MLFLVSRQEAQPGQGEAGQGEAGHPDVVKEVLQLLKSQAVSVKYLEQLV